MARTSRVLSATAAREYPAGRLTPATTSTVTLPREQKPFFPECCCSCLGPGPHRRQRVAARAHGFADLFAPLLWLFKKPYRCEVPICVDCLPQLRRQRWLQWVVMVVGVVAVVAALRPLVKQLPWLRPFRELIAVGILAAALAPFFLWQARRPLAFEVEVDRLVARFTFRNEAYAGRFHLVNLRPVRFEPSPKG